MQIYKVLGMMSGTSLDGLDLAFCHFWKENSDWHFSIEKTTTVDYSPELTRNLKEAISFSAVDLFALDVSYGKFLGSTAAQFLSSNNLSADLIASHGHTVHHRPDLGFTLQIGNGQQIANITGLKTICDFRSKDISLGGQGAPLVPVGDHLFFNQYQYCLNLGGISNISLVKEGKRIAYDIGIANMLLNYICQKMGLAYDENGALARGGNTDQQLLDKLNALEYYSLPFPKSTGFEWFETEIVPLIESANLREADLISTSVQHICEQISSEVLSHSTSPGEQLMITGGGAFNKYLIENLQEQLQNRVEIFIPDNELISFKEALVFAFMGLLREHEEINVYSSVTGSAKDSSSGVTFWPA